MAAPLRRAILAAAASPRVGRVVRRHGMRLGAARFVAGETLDEAVPVLRRLNDHGLLANTTLLGENVGDRAQAEAVVAAYEQALDRIAAERLGCNLALKLTHLGLLVDEQVAQASLARLLERAAAHGNTIRIDMEQSAYVDATLRVYRGLRAAGHDNVGCVLQAYLYRSEQDLEELLPLAPRVRIVKGAYLEPPELAYPRKPDVDAAYARLVERAFAGGAHTAVATHDERLIEHALALPAPGGGFELQLLYGVRPKLQLELARRGHTVRIATPYGPEWYPYLMRRLGERPANLLFLFRNLLKG
jgi:proline dehydrogenase